MSPGRPGVLPACEVAELTACEVAELTVWARAVRSVARRAALALPAAALVVALGTGEASAHLFHVGWEPPATQLTRDTRTMQLLLDDPVERFDLVAEVWHGRTRVRLKPGGFRRWLVRPNEPGMVFKADFQLARWSGSLHAEAERLDAAQGSRLAPWQSRLAPGGARLAPRALAALAGRDREGLHAVLRELYAALLEEMLERLWERLDEPEAAARLYGFVLGYWSVNLEGYFNIRQPAAAPVARAALDAIGRALGDPDAGAPAAPETFERQRRRFVRILREAVPGA